MRILSRLLEVIGRLPLWQRIIKDVLITILLTFLLFPIHPDGEALVFLPFAMVIGVIAALIEHHHCMKQPEFYSHITRGKHHNKYQR